MSTVHTLRIPVEAFIAAANAFDVEATLDLFANAAVIDDPSTGERFDGHAGIRTYLERYFVDYRTVTRLLSIKHTGPGKASVRVDFTGDFGHEIGLLEIAVDGTGRIVRIDAALE